MPRYAFEVPGMNCPECERTIAEELRNIPHVRDARLDYESDMVVVEAPVTREAIADSIAGLGYRIRA